MTFKYTQPINTFMKMITINLPKIVLIHVCAKRKGT